MYARGNRRQAIFLDDDDRERYLALLGRVVDKRLWRCLGYCLMGNHIHLLVETREPNLAAGMQYLHGVFAQGFNERHGYSGHLFEGRYGCTRITSDAQLLQTARYLARNPLEAGMCRRAQDYAWSSHAHVLEGGSEAPAWLDRARLLAFFAADGGDPLHRYRTFVDADDRSMGAAGFEPATSRV